MMLIIQPLCVHNTQVPSKVLSNKNYSKHSRKIPWWWWWW